MEIYIVKKKKLFNGQNFVLKKILNFLENGNFIIQILNQPFSSQNVCHLFSLNKIIFIEYILNSETRNNIRKLKSYTMEYK